MNSWLIGSLANQHLLQGQNPDSAALQTMNQIKAAQEEAELEDLEGADWQDEFALRRHYPRKYAISKAKTKKMLVELDWSLFSEGKGICPRMSPRQGPCQIRVFSLFWLDTLSQLCMKQTLHLHAIYFCCHMRYHGIVIKVPQSQNPFNLHLKIVSGWKNLCQHCKKAYIYLFNVCNSTWELEIGGSMLSSKRCIFQSG